MPCFLSCLDQGLFQLFSFISLRLKNFSFSAASSISVKVLGGNFFGLQLGLFLEDEPEVVGDVVLEELGLLVPLVL